MQSTLVARLFRGSLFFVLALIAAMFPRVLDLSANSEQWAIRAAIIALFMQGIIWTNIIVGYFVQRYSTYHTTDGSSVTTFKAIGVLVRLTVYITLGLVGLYMLDVQIKPLLTGLGIGGLAIAFAVQTTLADLFAAIAIVVDKPFVLGDAISVDNYRGKVEHIGLKTTRVRSDTGEQIIFSNGELLKSKIRNYSR